MSSAADSLTCSAQLLKASPMIEQFIDWVSGTRAVGLSGDLCRGIAGIGRVSGLFHARRDAGFSGRFSRLAGRRRRTGPETAHSAGGRCRDLGRQHRLRAWPLAAEVWFLRYGRWLGLREPQWQRLEDFFHRHGGKTVFFARFSAFFRILVPFFAGAVRLRYLHFLKWNIAGGLLWATGSVLLGYLAGESWRMVEHWIGRAACWPSRR